MSVGNFLYQAGQANAQAPSGTALNLGNLDLTVKSLTATGGLGATAPAVTFTQTYATASSTHANPTAVSGTSSAGANGYSSAAEAAAIQTAVNALVADVANVKQVLNRVIDILQAAFLAG